MSQPRHTHLLVDFQHAFQWNWRIDSASITVAPRSEQGVRPAGFVRQWAALVQTARDDFRRRTSVPTAFAAQCPPWSTWLGTSGNGIPLRHLHRYPYGHAAPIAVHLAVVSFPPIVTARYVSRHPARCHSQIRGNHCCSFSPRHYRADASTRRTRFQTQEMLPVYRAAEIRDVFRRTPTV